MKRPIIGIIPGWDTENKRYTLGEKYAGWIELCGGTPLILPYTTRADMLEQTVKMLDGILFTGGPDVSPELYGEPRLDCCEASQLNRDEMERDMFRLAVEKHKKPALGICKGCQIINSMLGGTLYQDIKTQFPSPTIDHRRPKSEEPQDGEAKTLFKHMATLNDGAPLLRIAGQREVEISSYHHQAVKKLAPGLEVMAVAPDGVIEAFYAPDGPFLWGVQFHPEMFEYGHWLSRLIFEEFIKNCM